MTPDHLTYTNPVYPGYFADPFVLEVEGRYYAFGTGPRAPDGGAFEVLESVDLVNWRSLGHALEPLQLETARDYWAAEVAFQNGEFFMYYSAGVNDKHHQVRVARSQRPQGPYRDESVILSPDDPFTIDASPFRDDDGQWYLFYARDFLDGARPGTALAVDRLETMRRLEGRPRTVLRASADWQLFAREREMYGSRYDWHTLEGPFVVKRLGRYWCFYSGGAWEQPNYGVSYAVADHPLGPWTEPESTGPDSSCPTVLHSVPGHVIGPGHNSVVRGPDGADYIVYHAWDEARTARRMCIDRLNWTEDGPRTTGPSFTPQPAPDTSARVKLETDGLEGNEDS